MLQGHTVKERWESKIIFNKGSVLAELANLKPYSQAQLPMDSFIQREFFEPLHVTTMCWASSRNTFPSALPIAEASSQTDYVSITSIFLLQAFLGPGTFP